MQELNDLSSILRARNLNLPSIFEAVVKSGVFVLGEYVERFESEFSSYLGGKVDVVSCANGTDALYLAIQAANLPPGSLVATVPNAGFYSTNAILRAGHVPTFMDVDFETGTVIKDEIVRSIEIGAKAVVVTHLFGNPFPHIEEIEDLCQTMGVWLVEDCAQAHGAEVSGRKVGTFGDVGTFSFYPSKNLGALGDGGAAVAKDHIVSERLRGLRQYGWGEKYNVDLRGGVNSRLDALQANLLRHFLPFLDAENAKRREIARAYIEGIHNPSVVTPDLTLISNSVWHLFVVRVMDDKREQIMRHLRERGIATAIHYPVLDHRTAAYSDLTSNGGLTNAELRSGQILTLPMYPSLTPAAVSKIVEAINEF